MEKVFQTGQPGVGVTVPISFNQTRLGFPNQRSCPVPEQGGDRCLPRVAAVPGGACGAGLVAALGSRRPLCCVLLCPASTTAPLLLAAC